mmetsp:Transcript_61717/g.145907  ORF Transcript_61717/g.145907 Transcript_61717/m.145907 type:complete len:200 (-) Transcript_61717:108-707(-)
MSEELKWPGLPQHAAARPASAAGLFSYVCSTETPPSYTITPFTVFCLSNSNRRSSLKSNTVQSPTEQLAAMKRRMSWREEDFTALRNELEEKTAELIVPSEGTNLSVSLLRRTHIVVIEIRNVDATGVLVVTGRVNANTSEIEPRLELPAKKVAVPSNKDERATTYQAAVQFSSQTAQTAQAITSRCPVVLVSVCFAGS